jgi:hypothetical protein
MKKSIICILMTLSFNCFAISSFWIGTGTQTHNFLSAQNNTSGSKKVVEFAPTILAGLSLPFFFSGVYFSPAIGYSKFTTKDNTTKSDLILQYHLTHATTSYFQYSYGFSNYITKIGGDGGSLVLNNGSGTATMYTPKETKTSYTASLDIAGDLLFLSNWSTRIQFSLLRFLSSTSRRVSNLITINYNF